MVNLANKLRKVTKWYKLYSLIHGDVEFIELDKDDCIVVRYRNEDSDFVTVRFDKYGRYLGCPNGECLIFPSKSNKDWFKFCYLDEGHRVMVSMDGSNWCLKRYKSIGLACDMIHDEKSKDWKYIVPVEEFNFNAIGIESNCNKSIV